MVAVLTVGAVLLVFSFAVADDQHFRVFPTCASDITQIVKQILQMRFS